MLEDQQLWQAGSDKEEESASPSRPPAFNCRFPQGAFFLGVLRSALAHSFQGSLPQFVLPQGPQLNTTEGRPAPCARGAQQVLARARRLHLPRPPGLHLPRSRRSLRPAPASRLCSPPGPGSGLLGIREDGGLKGALIGSPISASEGLSGSGPLHLGTATLPKPPWIAPPLTGFRLRGALQERCAVRALLAVARGQVRNRGLHDVSRERRRKPVSRKRELQQDRRSPPPPGRGGQAELGRWHRPQSDPAPGHVGQRLRPGAAAQAPPPPPS